jgi:hypothetical protein
MSPEETTILQIITVTLCLVICLIFVVGFTCKAVRRIEQQLNRLLQHQAPNTSYQLPTQQEK